MLASLSIRNVVLIDQLDLNFGKGLCVFTGETGAGKSMLLDSLSLVLGARADTGLIRHGESQLSVSATFVLPHTHPVWQILTEQGIDCADQTELFLRRVVLSDGKSKAFINHEPVSVSFLKIIGEMLVEVHGQFATHGLLNPATHGTILDTYGGLNKQKEKVAHLFQVYKAAQAELNEAQSHLENAAKEENYLRESIESLEVLQPQAGEEETLSVRRTQLMNSEKIMTCIDTAYQLLTAEENGITRQLALVSRQIEKAAGYMPERFASLVQSLDEAQAILADVSGELENIGESIGDISELETIDNRLFALRDAARRFHVDIDGLPALLTAFRDQISKLEKGEEYIRICRQRVDEARQHYLGEAHILSDNRHKQAQKLDKTVMKELPALKLEKAVFQTQIVSDDRNESADGIDSVAFLVATNPGMPPAPLNKIASGGELARFMLALKVNLAQTETMDTLVFDEVDSGVGGATAAAVGERLAQLAQECQVLVVTHSPQVAACGESHWTVSKSVQKGRTLTSVDSLDEEGRLTEIARMLSGAETTETARTMAYELLNNAHRNKPQKT